MRRTVRGMADILFFPKAQPSPTIYNILSAAGIRASLNSGIRDGAIVKHLKIEKLCFSM